MPHRWDWAMYAGRKVAKECKHCRVLKVGWIGDDGAWVRGWVTTNGVELTEQPACVEHLQEAAE